MHKNQWSQRHAKSELVKVDLVGVFYKSVRDIVPGEEMLLYAREAVYPELELEALARHNSLTGESRDPLH
ncbi:hypothetical protein RRG08_003551 [Elysia crispata]|uniref:Uncharacterized protein n=1 Tax=Elysia crispata TaxID=231223 RepID=A0AAE0Y6Y3_9GAST|nr:hypothetical protein RRG08_003551 [Elysia crispata]